ncbi:hypothetical protein AB1Y20_000760 [Prymnesium parvum]|uniref:Uncharacterized protein n=1 Tax=Prymnesium parvum TaxID=97485 RepID=A0AB34K9L0_PRYPA
MNRCCCAPGPRSQQPKKPYPSQEPADGGFYNIGPHTAPKSYYYLQTKSSEDPTPMMKRGRMNYLVPPAIPSGHPVLVNQTPPETLPCLKPDSAQFMSSGTKPKLAPASSLYYAMIQAATVEVKPSMSVDELKGHVREVMKKMTEARSAGEDSSPSSQQRIAREVSDALSAKVEMAVATAASRSVEVDASLQSLRDLETRIQRTLDGPHADSRMPEASALRDGLSNVKEMIAKHQA